MIGSLINAEQLVEWELVGETRTDATLSATNPTEPYL
jgi:hypothetical protein